MPLHGTIDFLTARNWEEKGSNFFDEVTKFLSKTLNVKFVFIDQYNKENRHHVDSISMVENGHNIKNISYRLKGSPCEQVVRGNYCHYKQDVQKLFPDDKILTDLNIASYAGAPTFSSSGEINGLVAIMHDDLIDNPHFEPMLKLFSSNIGGQIEAINMREGLKGARQLQAQSMKVLDLHTIISTTDKSGKILYANDMFCEISGYSREELIGSDHSILKSGEHNRLYYQSLYKTIVSGRTWNGDFKNKRKDGSYYWVAATIQPTYSRDGDLDGYITIRTDISKQKEAYYEIEQESVAKDHFLSNISHELRTPLNALMGYAQLIDIGPLTSEQSKYITGILTASDQLIERIDQLLSFEHDIVQAEGFCALKPCLDAVLETVTPLIQASKIQLYLDVASDVLVNVSDKNLRSILSNIISNAIKYNREEGKLAIQAKQVNNDFITVYIKDTGIGIPEVDQAIIFQRFNRGRNANSRIAGNGLGLSIVKELIDKIGGSIECKSDGASWSEFILNFPCEVPSP